MKKYIPYDYLCSKANSFPFVYKLLYLKILDEAPAEMLDREATDSAFHDGYKAGVSVGYSFGYQDACQTTSIAKPTNKRGRRPVK